MSAQAMSGRLLSTGPTGKIHRALADEHRAPMVDELRRAPKGLDAQARVPAAAPWAGRKPALTTGKLALTTLSSSPQSRTLHGRPGTKALPLADSRAVGGPIPFSLLASYFALALAGWVAASCTLLVVAPRIAAQSPMTSGPVLAAHLVALELLPFAVTGASFHLLPVMLRNDVRHPRRLVLALPLLAGGFLVAPGVAFDQASILWPGAALVAAGMLLVLSSCSPGLACPTGTHARGEPSGCRARQRPRLRGIGPRSDRLLARRRTVRRSRSRSLVAHPSPPRRVRLADASHRHRRGLLPSGVDGSGRDVL